jgi:hypothetical protein
MMNRQQQRKLKKHPLIRFIRGIFRLMRVIFRSGSSHPRVSAIELAEIERIEIERDRILQAEADRERILAEQAAALAERYITVGDLLNRVQWQSSAPKDVAVTSASKLQIPAHDVSLN